MLESHLLVFVKARRGNVYPWGTYAAVSLTQNGIAQGKPASEGKLRTRNGSETTETIFCRSAISAENGRPRAFVAPSERAGVSQVRHPVQHRLSAEDAGGRGNPYGLPRKYRLAGKEIGLKKSDGRGINISAATSPNTA